MHKKRKRHILALFIRLFKENSNMRNCISIASLAICSIIITSCNKSKTTSTIEENYDVTVADEASAKDALNKSKTILYTIPAPVEVASFIKESGAKYDEDLLHDINKANSYDTNLKMALNLGIYTTDMSFTNIFEQSQKVVDYITSLKRLTERLGIVQLIDEETINKIEAQSSSKEELLNIVSEVYMNANQYLTENNRKNISAEVMVGCWTEGLYIALNLINNSEKSNRQLTERVIAQKLALATIMNILETSNPNGYDDDLTYLTNKMQEIRIIFDEVKAEPQGQVIATTDASAHLTTIKANIKSEISPEIMHLLTEKVNQIRKEFIE